MSEQNKIRKAKFALKKALAELQPGDTFNVITFCGTFTSFAPVPQSATPANLRAAARFVDLARMGEGTNLGAALKAAFASDPVTQVWVLSDGVPNVGITDSAELRALVRQQGGGRAQVITLALGLGQNFPGVELLQALAADNNGTFQLVDLRDTRRR
jgi:Mg-chelatase subunit ChlD